MQEFIYFIVFTILFALYFYFIENPPLFALNFLAPRLHKKIIRKLTEFYERQNEDSKDLEDKDLKKSIEKELLDVKKTKKLVYDLISKYQDENKSTLRILRIWYKYLKLEYEYVDKWTSGYGEFVEYEEIREMAILIKAYQDILKEFQEHLQFSKKYF